MHGLRAAETVQTLGIRFDNGKSSSISSAEAVPVLLIFSRKSCVLKSAAMNALFPSGLNGHNVRALAAGLPDGAAFRISLQCVHRVYINCAI